MVARVGVEFVAKSQMGAALADIAKVRASLASLAAEMQTLGKTNGRGVADLNRQFLNNINSMSQFETMSVRTRTTTQRLTDDIIKQKIAMKDMASVRANLNNLASEQIRLQQSQAMVTSRGGGMAAGHLIQPINALTTAAEHARVANGILGESMMSAGQASIKAGKNMQWSGRQLMSGFTAPIGIAAGAAGKFAYDIDASMVRLTKVYGDTAGTSQQELAKVRDATMQTAKSVARDFGLAGNDTIQLAADFAAAGKSGDELQKATYETSRIATLGELDHQKAMNATITMQTVFGVATADLADKFNFLNAVENQTNTTLQDLTDVIPRTAGIIKDLGGTIEDSALFTVAFKEAGIDAVQGANALRSSLGAIIAPSGVASKKLQGLGIDMNAIVEKNRAENGGSLIGLLKDLGAEMSNLGSVERQRALSVLFGRYQFNKMGGLLKGLTEDTNDMSTQMGRAFALTGASTKELADVADRELKQMSESLSGRLTRALRTAQVEFAEFGRPLLAAGVKIMEIIGGIVGMLNKMPKPLKFIAGLLAGGLFVAGPLIYIAGLFKNLYGQVFRFTGLLLKGKAGWKGMLTPQGVFAKQAETQVIPAVEGQVAAFKALEIQIQRTGAALAALAVEQKATAAGAAAGSTAGRRNYPKGSKDANGKPLTGFMPKSAAPPTPAATSTFLGMPGSRVATSPLNTPGNTNIPSLANPAKEAGVLSSRLATAREHMRGIISGAAMVGTLLIANSGLTGAWANAAQGVLMSFMLFPGILVKIASLMGVIATRMIGIQRIASLKALFGMGAAVGPMGKVIGLFGKLKFAVMGALGPIGWIAAGLVAAFGLYKMWQKHLEKIRKETHAVNEAAKNMAGIVGYEYQTAAAGSNKVAEAHVKTLQEEAKAWADSGDQAKIAAEKLRDAKNQEDAVRQARAMYVDAFAHGANRQQAEKTVKIALTVAGMNEKDIDNVIATQFQDINTAVDARKEQLVTLGENYGKSLTQGMGKGAKADQMVKDFAAKFAASFDKSDMQGFLDRMDELKAMVAEKNSHLLDGLEITNNENKLLKVLNIDPKSIASVSAGFDTIKNHYDSLTDEQKAAYSELSRVGPYTLGTLGSAAEQAAHSEMRLVDALKVATGQNTKQNKSVDTLSEYTNLYNGYVQRTTAAQADYNEQMHMASRAGIILSDAEKLKMLNVARATAGLVPATLLTDGFGAATISAATDVNVLADTLAAMNPAQFAQGLQKNLSNIMQEAGKMLTEQYDADTQAQKDKADSDNKIWQDSFDGRVKASDKSFDQQAKGIDKTQKAAVKALDASQKKEMAGLQSIEDMRKKMFAAEMTRIERLAAAANTNIDINVALNSGNLDEAARLQNTAYVTDVRNNMDDASANADEVGSKRMDKLSTKHDAAKTALEEKQALQKQELDDQRQHQKDLFDAEKKRHDDTFAVAQKRYDRERAENKKTLDKQLKDVQEFVPKNQAEWDKMFATMNGMAQKFGVVALTKTSEWTTMNKQGMHQAYADTFKELSDAAQWTALGTKSMESLTQGMLGMTFEEFADWMKTGKMPDPKAVKPKTTKIPKPPGLAMSQANWDANVNASHGGGPAGRDNGRAGRPKNAPLYPDEVPTILQKGEYVLDKHTVKNMGMERVKEIHRNKGRENAGPYFHTGGLVGSIGALTMATMTNAMGMAIQAGAQRKANEMAAQGSYDSIPQALQASVQPAGVVSGDYAHAILDAIKMHESGGNYKAEGPGSASGAYQYVDGTWNGYGGVGHASLATPELQDNRAMSDLMAAYKRLGDWQKAIANHFYPAWANRPDLWGNVPAPGNPTVRAYVDDILQRAGLSSGAGMPSGGYSGPAPYKANGGTVTGDIQGLNMLFLQRLANWSKSLGEAYNVGSGFRSMAEQAKLYAAYKAGVPGQAQAAAPGLSNHNYGLASDGPHWRDRGPERFGLTYPMSYEPWHVEPINAKGMRVPQLKVGGTVNYDNTLANLHRNETVLTAPLSAQLERGISNMDNSSHPVYNINVHGAEGQSTTAIAKAVRLELERAEVSRGINRRVR